jgi:hypothetical protein
MQRQSSPTGLDIRRVQRLQFLSSAIYVANDMNLATEPGETPVETILHDWDATAWELVKSAHVRLLDATVTTFPFTRALLLHQIRSRGGPLYATALVLAALAFEREPPEEGVILSGLAAECLMPVYAFLSDVCARTDGELDKLNNALAVLAADFTASHAVSAISRVSTEAARRLAQAARESCEAGMIETSEEFNLDRPAAHYISTVEKSMGGMLGFAVALGAELAGASPQAAHELRRYGQRLGVAQRITSDIAEIEEVDRSRRALGRSIRLGRYGFPMLLAFERDASVRRAVTAGPARNELGEMVAMLRATGALDDARQIAEQQIEQARDAMRTAAAPRPDGLDELVGWVVATERPALSHAG